MAKQGHQSEIAEWRARFDAIVPVSHPRVHVTQANLPQFKEYTSHAAWRLSLLPAIRAAAHSGMPTEPVSFGPKPFSRSAEATALWREAYGTAGEAGGRAQALAFGYLLTGNVDYAMTAKAIALEMARWDPEGTTAIDYNDEAFIRVIHFLPFVYSWIYDVLTQGERQILEEAIRRRGEILYEHVSNRLPLGEDALDSHPVRFVSTLGLAGLALYHELDEAQEWLAWAAAYYQLRFPVWGGDAGGWSEGLDYWSSGILSHLEFLDALATIGIYDLYDKPFFRQTAYFGLYFLPKYPTTSFGDINPNKTSLKSDSAALVRRLAHVYEDPFLYEWIRAHPSTSSHWYGSLLYPQHIHNVLHAGVNLEAKPLSTLAPSRHFEDVGWVAMHSNLGRDEDDIFLAFKSSPYGSVSHSHADQNSFILNAFGRSLFISSGYREWWQSDHHWQWYKQTLSKNAVLIAGEGQAHHSASHPGAIIGFFGGDHFSWTVGEAASAYLRSTKYGRVNHWQRSILFVNREYFLIHDYVSTALPVQHQWLLHADQEMEIDQATNLVRLRVDDVGVDAHILHPAPSALHLTQTNRFATPVDPSYRDRYPEQWHFQAQTRSKERERDFAVVLYPYRSLSGEEETAAQVTSHPVDGGLSIIVDQNGRSDRVLMAWESLDQSRDLDGVGLRLRGRLGAVVGEQGTESALKRWFLHGERLEDGGRLLWEATQPGVVEAALYTDRAELLVALSAPGEASLYVPLQPRSIVMDGEALPEDAWRYDPDDSGRVRLTLPAKQISLTVQF